MCQDLIDHAISQYNDNSEQKSIRVEPVVYVSFLVWKYPHLQFINRMQHT